MSETKRAPRFAWVQVDRRPRGWGSVRIFARGVAFPAVICVGLLVWCVHGFGRVVRSPAVWISVLVGQILRAPLAG